MGVEYRPATAEEMPAFVYTDRVAFGNSTAPDEIERALGRMSVRPEMTLCAFENGVPVANMATLPFTIRWNGRDIGCGGVTDVGTLPTHRRQGHLRALMQRSFATMREREQPIAMLWASMAAIYQRFGYGIASTRLQHSFDPRLIRFVDDLPTPGRVRLFRAEGVVPVIAEAYARFAAPRTLMPHRGDENWKWVLERQWGPSATPWLVAVYEEAGEVLGYAVYTVEAGARYQTEPYQQLWVTDFVWLTPGAHRARIRYLSGYDLVGNVNLYRLPSDDPLFFGVQEPRLLDTRMVDGVLVRIVDLLAALEGRGYDADGRISFSLADDLCPWNAGSWELTVEDGHGTVRRVDADTALRFSPRALAILASGHLSATVLAHVGQAAGDPKSLAVADALFRTAYAPCCLDSF